MEKVLDDYLEKVEKYLKPIPISERIDIVKEIKSEILELQNQNKTTEEILQRLGEPKDLAKAYIGDLLTNDTKLGWPKVLTVCAFYSVVGFSGMFIIPALLVIVPTFLVMGIVTPILAAIKMIDYILHLGIPYMQNVQIVFAIGMIKLNPIGEFIIAIPVGFILYFVGKKAWKLLMSYCRTVSKTHKKLSI